VEVAAPLVGSIAQWAETKAIGIVLVVAIEEREHVGPGGFDGRVAGRSHAAVFRPAGHSHAAVGGGPAFEDLPGVVGRAVVDGHEFPVGEFLLRERAQGAVEREGPVIDGHDDGDRGLHFDTLAVLLKDKAATMGVLSHLGAGFASIPGENE